MSMTSNSIRTNRLAELELFAGADREELELVGARCVEVDVPKGREILREGEQAREFVVVLDGYAVVTAEGREIAYLGAGSCFGEMALIDGSPRSATVRAKTDCEVVPIREKTFLFLVHETPYFAIAVMRTLADRLRRSSERT